MCKWRESFKFRMFQIEKLFCPKKKVHQKKGEFFTKMVPCQQWNQQFLSGMQSISFPYFFLPKEKEIGKI